MIPLFLLGCDGWDLPEGGYSSVEALWDPNVVAATDGVYVRLPRAGKLLRVTDNGQWSEVDLDGASPGELLPTADGSGVFLAATWPICDDDDPLIEYVDDCPESKLTYGTEMVLVKDGKRMDDGALPNVAPQFNTAAYTHDNSLAALYLNFQDGDTVTVNGFVNLNEVAFVGLVDGATHRVSVGFAAETVLFNDDDSRAVILSRSQVAVVNLANASATCEAWSVCVTYPLTLDSDQAVVPSGVVLVEDGSYALVSVSGKKDVYVLDLVNESIDLLELEAVPSAMVDDKVNGRTVFVYANSARADVVDHLFFELRSVTLEEPANRAIAVDNGTLLYSTGTFKDVVMLDALSGNWHEQRAENPIIELHTVNNFAVATLAQETTTGGSGTAAFYDQNFGLGIFSLAPVTGDAPPDPISLVLQSQPVGIATVGDETSSYALLLLDGVDTLLKVTLDDASAEDIALEAPPLGIQQSPDGRFVVTGDSSMGMVSFVDPVDNGIVTVAGFATLGLADSPRIPRREAQE